MSKNAVIITIKNICVTVLIYLLQFIVFPAVFQNYYPKSTESSLIMFAVFFVGYIAGFCLVTKKIGYWIFPDIVYCLMVLVYSGKGLYGVGMRGISLDGASPYYDFSVALIWVGAVLVLILLIQLIIVFCLWLRSKIKKIIS